LCLPAHVDAVSVQVSTVLQPLMTADPPPTYFKTDMFTNCFQVRPLKRVAAPTSIA
jgi:hypothetical protein